MDKTQSQAHEDPADLPANAARGKALSPAALRALQEAEARRKSEATADTAPKEIDGRNGPEPTRYGDWEKNGTAVDF